jgi:hypothetical protein
VYVCVCVCVLAYLCVSLCVCVCTPDQSVSVCVAMLVTVIGTVGPAGFGPFFSFLVFFWSVFSFLGALGSCFGRG